MGVRQISWLREGRPMSFDIGLPMQRYPAGPSAGELRAILEAEIEVRSPDFYKSQLLAELAAG